MTPKRPDIVDVARVVISSKPIHAAAKEVLDLVLAADRAARLRVLEDLIGRQRDLERISRVAHDSDHEVLDRLTVEAGIIWVCEECGWRNVEDEDRCGDPNCPTNRRRLAREVAARERAAEQAQLRAVLEAMGL